MTSEQYRLLRELVAKTDFYQPLFRIGPEVDLVGPRQPLRDCVDRLAVIRSSLPAQLNQLRILDVGSSLGFMSLSLAEQGALVTGIEWDARNVQVSRLVAEITGVQADFQTIKFDQAMVDSLAVDHYDVGLFLSVLHHVMHVSDFEHARHLVRQVVGKIRVIFFELAQREELAWPRWKAKLPEDHLALFDGIDADIELLGAFPTHLSDLLRPLYRLTRRS